MQLCHLVLPVMLALAPSVALGVEIRLAYDIPIGDDEGDFARIALGGGTLVVGRSDRIQVDLYEARTGALRATLPCLLDADRNPLPPCWAEPQASVESYYGTVLVFAADGGAPLQTLFHPPPAQADLFALDVVFDRGLLATTSDAYLGDGRLWTYRRRP